MSFDGIFTHYLVQELNNQLINGRINKIYQLSDYELVLVIRANTQTLKLLLSIHPIYARVHFTKQEQSYPKEPPMFCMLLRKHLEGGKLVGIHQKDNDRIIEFSIEHMNELGDKETKLMIVEIMGKHSNIALLNANEGTIIDSIKHISPFQSSVRTLQPGATYLYPPTSNKINFFLATKADFQNVLDLGEPYNKQLVNYFEGLSPLFANEFLKRANYNQVEAYYATYLAFLNEFHSQLSPSIMTVQEKEVFYLVPFISIGQVVKSYDTISEMLDRFFFNKDSIERVKQQSQDLEKYIKNECEKNRHKLDHLKTDLLTAQQADQLKLCGELIIANCYQLSKGQSSCVVPNYYQDGEQVTIELDPLLTPIENSQRYYTKYQKAKKAVGHIHHQLELTEQEILYFEALYDQLKNATIQDAVEIRQELESLGYLKKHLTKQKKMLKPHYSTFLYEGVELLVGKNNLQNEYITHRVANRNDYWLHVKDMPGSHVVIRCEEITEPVLRCAAQLAAYYSKGKLSSSVPVDYTQIKHVKKVPNSKLGYVTYDHQKTIYIDPDEDFIVKLNQK